MVRFRGAGAEASCIAMSWWSWWSWGRGGATRRDTLGLINRVTAAAAGDGDEEPARTLGHQGDRYPSRFPRIPTSFGHVPDPWEVLMATTSAHFSNGRAGVVKDGRRRFF